MLPDDPKNPPLPDDWQGGPASDEAATDFAEEQRQQGAPVANPSSRNTPPQCNNPDGVD